MTSLLEKIVAIIAPHYCLACSAEDNILCDNCLLTEQNLLPSLCCLCGVPSVDWRVCPTCAPKTPLVHIWAGGVNEGVLERLIHSFKFGRLKQAAIPLSKIMLQTLPYDDWTIVCIPTAAQRVRQRGYDQSHLLASAIATERGYKLSPALLRVRGDRQVGANRVQRYKQSQGMFCVRIPSMIAGAKIILIDDVCTTGATLSAAAKALRSAGAAEVHACVAAWQPKDASDKKKASRI